MSDLLSRLRGVYSVPVNDGGGLLEGKDTFTRTFPATPINLEAADAIEALQTQLNECREALKVLQYIEPIYHTNSDAWLLLRSDIDKGMGSMTIRIEGVATEWIEKYKSIRDAALSRVQQLTKQSTEV